jgi:hypothetical protein
MTAQLEKKFLQPMRSECIKKTFFLIVGVIGGYVTTRIGLYVESDLYIYFREIFQTNLLGLYGFAANTKIDPILREI